MLFLETPQLRSRKSLLCATRAHLSFLLRCRGWESRRGVHCTDGSNTPQSGVQGMRLPGTNHGSTAHVPGKPESRVPPGLFTRCSLCRVALHCSNPRTSSIDHDLANESNETWPGSSRGSAQKEQFHRPKGAGRKTSFLPGELSSPPSIAAFPLPRSQRREGMRQDFT